MGIAGITGLARPRGPEDDDDELDDDELDEEEGAS